MQGPSRRKGLDGGASAARGLDVVGIGVAGAGGAASGIVTVVVLVFFRMFS